MRCSASGAPRPVFRGQVHYHQALAAANRALNIAGDSLGLGDTVMIMDTPLVELTWRNIGVIVVGGGVITTTLAGIAAYILARATKPIDAYGEEIAKQLAKKHGLDRLVQETQKLTSAAETIKANLSHENWDRQQRWAKKHEVYADTAQKLNRLIDAIGRVIAAEKTLVLYQRGSDNWSKSLSIRSERLEAMSACDQSLSDLVELVHLVGGFKTRTLLLSRRTLTMKGDGSLDLAESQVVLEDLIRLLNEFVAAARHDLGY